MRFFTKRTRETVGVLLDKCVICQKDTEYLFSTPVSERKFYIVGVGQICRDCCDKLNSSMDFVESEIEKIKMPQVIQGRKNL